MVSYLNPYRNFIDVSTKDGLTLLSNATDKFESPLVGDQRVSLSPGKNDFQLLKDNLMRLSKKFGYEYLLNNVATTRTVVPATGRTAATTTFSNPIKIMEVYDDKILELAQKHASITWGNESFTNQFPKTISDLTEANGHLDATGALTQDGKDIIQGRIHSKILAYQILAMLSDSARQVIERQAEEYTWKDLFGLDEEMDGMTILALVIRRLRPHHKVDMYAEIGLVKKLTLAQYDNDVHLFCDAINSKKLMIDMKDPMAYTDDALVRDLFHVFKHDSLPLDFRSEFTALERRWQMDKERVTSQSLMEDAGSYYTNMVASGDWKLEVGKNAQIIALTTQISELKTAFNQIKIDKPTKPSSDDTSKQLRNSNDSFQRWRLTKVNNDKEFNMIEKEGKTYYWCDQHKHHESEQWGMYVFHKPTEHGAWKKKKDEFNARKKGKGKPAEQNSTATPSTAPPAASNASASKLSLAKSLQEALTTNAGLSEDQFNKIWADACSASGN